MRSASATSERARGLRRLALVAACVGATLGAAGRARVERSENAPRLAGQVLDRRTQRPVVDFELEIRWPEGPEIARTDRAGRFRSVVDRQPGEVEIALVDAALQDRGPRIVGLDVERPIPLARRVWTAERPEIALEVDAGPELSLAFALTETPPDVARCRARLEAWTPGAVESSAALEAPVRVDSGRGPWVRFAATEGGLFGRPMRARLVVTSADGLLRAEGDATAALDGAPGTIPLTWAPCARWTGTLRDPRGGPLAWTWLTLARVGDKGQVIERQRLRTDAAGGYAFASLPPGAYLLSGSPLRYREFSSQKRALVGAGAAKLDITVESVPLAGPLAGRIDGGPVADAAEPVGCTLVLRRAGDTLPMERATPRWHAVDGRWRAEFAFADLPPGGYRIQVVPGAGDAARFEPPQLAATAPAQDLAIIRRAP